jgi:SAM-dependent methyltransferase
MAMADTSKPPPGVASNTPYDDAFFREQLDSSRRSAACVVPIVLSLVPAGSVVDVGCGVGAWAARFLEHGLNDVVGMDGDYVNRQLLQIPPACFHPCDLRQPIRADRRFDLAVCLEVAEHLPEIRAAGLVEDLTRLAPVILFSAALPGQGGTDHINEQYLSYWVDLFAGNGFVLLDVIRPKIWQDTNCAWVYRQNTVLFAEKAHPVAARLHVASGVDYVHPYILDEVCSRLNEPTLGYLVRSFPGSLRRSVRSRLRRLFRS